MKNSFLTGLVVLVASLSVIAQQSITITADDMPNTGDNYLFDEAIPALQFNANATGDNYVWDYSTLQSNTQRTDSFLYVLQTPIIYNFVFNNIFDPERATIATNLALLPSFGNFPIPINLTDEYTYYREENDVYKAVGFAFTADYNGTGIPLPVQYNPVDKLYSFPLNNSTPQLVAQSGYSFQIPNLITFKEKRNRTTTVDGYGTLILPNAYLDVVRLKSVSVVTDSIRLDTLGGFWLPSQPRTEVEYKWMAQGYGEPVLTISGQQGFNNIFQVNKVRYRHFEPTAVWQNNAEKVTVYPVPSNGTMVINAKDIQQVTLTSIDGKEILTENISNNLAANYTFTLGYKKPAPGLYILNVTTKAATCALKIPIE